MALADPKENRLLIAVSTDGLTWNRVLAPFRDSADVPDAVLGPGGKIYLYFQNFRAPHMNRIYVGISNDGLTGWTFGPIVISGTEYWPGTPCDPDIIVSGDTFRLYFTGDPAGDMMPETYSATSLDGINFVIDSGIRFQVLDSAVLDPSLLWARDTLRYFAGGNTTPGKNYRAHSTDWFNFTRDPDFFMDTLMMANGLSVTGGYRFYGFKQNGIKSMFSTDGVNWNLESSYRLQLDTTTGLESGFVKDPAVVRTGSGYIMYYVTKIPAGNVHEGKAEPLSLAVYPNPARDLVRIDINLPEDKPCSVRLYEPTGKLIREVTDPRTRSYPLSVSDLLPGVYFVMLTDGRRYATRRITVIR